jgi:DNA-binding beta-propeller fold protein YncE
VARCEEGTLVVDSTQFSGSVEEVTLVHEPSQQRRRFFHRPRAGVLKTGDRVVLKTLLLLLVCLLLFPGCNDAETAELPVSEFHSWSLPPDGPKLPAPRGLTVGPDDSLYVLDDAGRVLVYDRLGTLNRKWRMPASEVGKPEGICILTDGRIAVADTHYHRVVYFDQTGDVLKIIGTLGQEPGQFKYPVALTQDDQENLYVCEYGSNDRVQRFSNDGEFLLEFGSHGTEAGQFQRPSGIVWHEGRVYVADAFNNRIQIFSEDGDFLAFLDSPQSETSLDYPYDLCLSAEGHLYAVEYRAGRVTGLDLSGRVLGVFGRSGRGQRQFATPWGIAVSQEGRLFVADTGNRRIVELRR